MTARDRVLALTAAAVVVLCGCGGNGDGGTRPSSNTAAGSPTATAVSPGENTDATHTTVLAKLADERAPSRLQRVGLGIKPRERARVHFAQMVVLVENLEKRFPVASDLKFPGAGRHQRIQLPGAV